MYSTPGVYIEEISSQSLTIENGATAIPVFIGRFFPSSPDAVEGECVAVSSWLDFTSKFGAGPVTATVKVAGEAVTLEELTFSPGYYAVQLYFLNGGGPCFILHFDAGDEAMLPTMIAREPMISLLVQVEQEDAEGSKNAVYTALAPLLAGDGGYFLIADSVDGSTGPTGTTAMQTGVYYPDLVTAWRVILPADEQIRLVGVTDIDNMAELKTENGQLYSEVQSLIGVAATAPGAVTLPPGAAVAGAYCATDRARGVWKAPANVALSGVVDVSKRISHADQGPMNVAGINAIRWFENRGFLIWGARTRDLTPDWRYVSVRRLFNMVERDCRASIERMVFEPNSQPTWERIRASLAIYLNGIWRQGGLKGNSEAEAFSVAVGLGTTMTVADVEAGLMVVRVALAPIRPSEFIVLEFSHVMASASG